MSKGRKSFTLIEVITAVMIISIVITALLQMRGNSAHMYLKLKDKIAINQYISFFISNPDYGFEDDSVDIYDLLENFVIEDDLRRELKNMKATIEYEKLKELGMNTGIDTDTDTDVEIDVDLEEMLEIGKTKFKIDNSSNVFLRLKVK
ncbi:MAG: prepilin-type N-terminal cleavage/methylation domain-containing protein [Sulfurospirillum sp.]|nr:prepilin-type N-terminal cleavage/methylation domain-containing protein [Sulfurospirillum sp.]